MIELSVWQAAGVTVLGLVVLVLSADRFLDGAAAIAKASKLSPMIIGLTIVSLGTSAPEIVVSFTAALTGETDIAIGNILGSITANVGLVLGVTALVKPLPFSPSVLRVELPCLVVGTLLGLACSLDGQLTIADGILLLAALTFVAFLSVRQAKNAPALQEAIVHEVESIIPAISLRLALVYFVLGLIVLLASARMLVWGGSSLAHHLGIPEVVIGLTIIAIGTSLPELAATLGSAIKGHHDIAIGNVVGSNIMNVLLVLPIPAITSQPYLSNLILLRDYGMVILMTVLLGLFAYGFSGRGIITRGEGAALLMAWIFYNVLLFVTPG